MSASRETFWLERWWPLLLIIYGVVFALILASFKPAW